MYDVYAGYIVLIAGIAGRCAALCSEHITVMLFMLRGRIEDV